MKVTLRIIQTVFAIPWLVFGVQHFRYGEFVANLVPAYFPVRFFWAYFTGAAMIAAGIGLIISIWARLAAFLLGTMLLAFILLIHVPTVVGAPSFGNWTRALQDLAIVSSAFMLAGAGTKAEGDASRLVALSDASRYVFAILLIIFGIQQFMHLEPLTVKVAPYIPFRMLLMYLTGSAMVVAGVSVLLGKKARLATISVGALMLALNLALHVYMLGASLYTPLHWTAAMLDLAITCGVFILAITLTDQQQNSKLDVRVSSSRLFAE